MSLWLQWLLVGVAVAASALFVIRRQWPQLVRRLRVAVAVLLSRPGRPRWLQGVGRKLAPRVQVSGCGGCDGCG